VSEEKPACICERSLQSQGKLENREIVTDDENSIP
jgi:hypothetical protein